MLLLLLPISVIAVADTREFTYTPPTTRVDNTALLSEEIAGYDVMQDGAVVETLSADATSFTVEVTPGTYSYTIVVIDTEGRRSSPSPAISFTAKARPSAVTITITIDIKGD